MVSDNIANIDGLLKQPASAERDQQLRDAAAASRDTVQDEFNTEQTIAGQNQNTPAQDKVQKDVNRLQEQQQHIVQSFNNIGGNPDTASENLRDINERRKVTAQAGKDLANDQGGDTNKLFR